MISELQTTLEDVLNRFEASGTPFHEYEVSKALRALKPAGIPWESLPVPLRAELMAFDFCEVHNEAQSSWETYYGPMLAVRTDDGRFIEWPSLPQVTPEVLDYWAQRARRSSHPVLRLRYADLTWDLSRPILGKSGDHELARAAVNAVLEIIARRLFVHEVNGIDKLRRALSLALSLSNTNLVEAVRDALIDFEDAIAHDEALGTWGFAFDQLVENKKIPLRPAQEEKLIKALEDRLLRCATPPSGTTPNHHAAHAAAIRLAQFYRRKNQRQDVHRVLKLWGVACLQAVKSQRALQAAVSVEEAYRIFMAEGMQAEAAQLSTKLRFLWQEVRSEMKAVKTEFSIPREDMDKYLAAMTEGPLDEVLARLAIHFVPSTRETTVRVRQLAKEAVITSLATKIIVDDAGRPLGRVGSLDSDPDSRVTDQMSQDLYLASIFLREALAKTIHERRPTLDDLASHLMKSPAFEPSKKEIIQAGIAAYLRRDWLVAVHILVPVVEDAIRTIVMKTTGNAYRPNRLGGVDYKPLHTLLEDPGVVGSLGEDVVSYCRALFVDPRGWNLRNRVCHGLMVPEEFNEAVADRTLHALLVLAQLRAKSGSEGEDAELPAWVRTNETG